MAGVGGYGGDLIEEILRIGHALPHAMLIAAVYEALPDRQSEMLHRLSSLGVAVCDDLGDLAKKDDLDVVWLPTPIHLHAPMTCRTLASGKPVMCEKPAAGSVAEVDSMIAARNEVGLPVLLGFQEVYDPTTQRLANMIREGTLGEILSVSVRACWPRPLSYFKRSNWAGRREVDGRPVHDSPANNALAHFVNLGLIFTGHENPGRVDFSDFNATLIRVNEIENYDTVALRTRVGKGTELSILLTHACTQTVDPVIEITGTQGRVRRTLEEIEVYRERRPVERWALELRTRRWMFEALGSILSGQKPAGQMLATLEMGRDHAALIEKLATVQIHDLADEAECVNIGGEDELLILPGIEDIFDRMVSTSASPTELLAELVACS